MKKTQAIIIFIIFLSLFFAPLQTSRVTAATLQSVTASDLISLVNGWRTANGYAALTQNSILMTTAYDTAVYMAVNSLSSHIGDVSGRVSAYGYGGGALVFATENFAVGTLTIEKIAEYWADDAHQLPATNSNYKDIGAAVYTYGDRTWYIVHAAYTSGTTVYATTDPLSASYTSTPSVSQVIIPVETVTPNASGAVVHEVLPGQALWSIAIAYNTKIDELVRLNNLDPDDPTIYVGQKLLIFEANTTPASTGISPTVDPSQVTPTITATPRPTRTKTILPSPSLSPTAIVASPTPQPTSVQQSSLNGVFQNKVVGIILVSILALGILLIVTGSFAKTHKPSDEKREE